MRSLTPPGSSAAAASTVSAEIGLIDRAREALERGDPSGALAALDQHEAEFATGALDEEAELLRLEALLARGQAQAAAAMARAFLQSHPKSPHADRARRVLERARKAAVASFPQPQEQP